MLIYLQGVTTYLFSKNSSSSLGPQRNMAICLSLSCDGLYQNGLVHEGSHHNSSLPPIIRHTLPFPTSSNVAAQRATALVMAPSRSTTMGQFITGSYYFTVCCRRFSVIFIFTPLQLLPLPLPQYAVHKDYEGLQEHAPTVVLAAAAAALQMKKLHIPTCPSRASSAQMLTWEALEMTTTTTTTVQTSFRLSARPVKVSSSLSLRALVTGFSLPRSGR